MSLSADPDHDGSKTARLLGFLEQDPDNLNLLAAAAASALDDGDPTKASELLDRCAAQHPLTGALQNLAGLAAMAEDRFEEAAGIFTGLLEETPTDPALRFNLAWCNAMLGNPAAAEGLIDDAVADAIPQAAALKIESLHNLTLLDDALEWGKSAITRRPDDTAALGALAAVALDAGQLEVARDYATRAGPDNVDGVVTLGMLELSDSRFPQARDLFDQAIHLEADSSRALLGLGLVQMLSGDFAGAARSLDAGAGEHAPHASPLVAAGWASFIGGDQTSARDLFARAIQADEASSEAFGGFAVLESLQGDDQSARDYAARAIALDPECASAALALRLLAARRGGQAG